MEISGRTHRNHESVSVGTRRRSAAEPASFPSSGSCPLGITRYGADHRFTPGVTLMACCDTNLTPPPPPFTPPPAGANGCQQTFWACSCIADVDTWVLIVNQCIDNAFCTGQLSCTPTDCVIELLNACVIADPAPVAPVPWCLPKCCDPPATTPPPTTPPTDPPDTYPPDETPPPSVDPTYPPIAPAAVTAPPTYPPDAPYSFCNCGYVSTWDCVSSTWGVPVLGLPCYEGPSAASAWAHFGSCDAHTTVSALGPCA